MRQVDSVRHAIGARLIRGSKHLGSRTAHLGYLGRHLVAPEWRHVEKIARADRYSPRARGGGVKLRPQMALPPRAVVVAVVGAVDAREE